MAAPCSRMASQRLVQFLCSFGTGGLRHISSNCARRAAAQSLNVEDRAASPWTLTAAVCVQRLPVISAECSPLEEQFTRLLRQMELEKSLLSDHELRLLEDADRLSRKQAGDYDSDDEQEHADDIVLAQDLEDSWEQRMKTFLPAPRVRDDLEKDVTSAQRCLADSLVLLAQQQVGDAKLWLLPQTQWQEVETLRQTAERAIATLPAGLEASILGNAPCGVYKYKLPKAVRTESSVGTKVFFFKALLSGGGPPSVAPDATLMWAKKSELRHYLKPAYLMKVNRFILGP
ncbi:large ribosomal subunit protein mL46 [Genypterus blacodes]|uniref:large ribosomal subunit protein mL46 n=1 Tax=Genypterus blacodes TaxID=154954 RepID=UPI003F77474B